jgi:lipopolysaccharide transport system permease protein
VKRLVPPRRLAQIQLVMRLAQRQISFRYRENALGVLWSVLSPLFLLIIYTVVYTQVFKAKWPADKQVSFALLIFSGLVLFNLHAEIVNGSTFLVQNNVPLIKRTTVSARVIPLAASIGAMMTFGLSLVPFAVLYGIQVGVPPATALLFPLLVLLEVLLATSLALFLAAASAYVRDLQQLIPLLTTAVLFMSPIFYPDTALPAGLRHVLVWINPLGIIIPASKDLLFYGHLPPALPFVIYGAVATVLFRAGWAVYGRASRGFGDVI